MDNRRHEGRERSSVRWVSEVWALPGYDVQGLLGYGACGEVWRAVELASGEPVALKRLRADADSAAVAALRREAAVLARLDIPYVVRLRAVLGEDCATVLVLDLAAGGSLAALLGRRGRLDPSEVVTLAAPLAQALAAVHAEGLLHGDITPSNVLFTAEGMPLLADLGLARLRADTGEVSATVDYVDPVVAAGGLPTPASDVWSLGALCHHALAGTPPYDGDSSAQVLQAAAAVDRAPLGLLAPTAPRPLVAAIEAALRADPEARPSASELAAALRRSHAAAPLRLAEPGTSGAPSVRATEVVHAGAASAPPAERRWPPSMPPPRVVALVVAAALLVLAGLGGWAWGRGGTLDSAVLAAPPAPPLAAVAAQRSPAPTDWRAQLAGLDTARARALADADPRALTAVYAPGSAALATDRTRVEALRVRGERLQGSRHVLREVTVLQAGPASARLRVVDALAEAVVVDGRGFVVRRVAGRSDRSFAFELVRVGAHWRIAAIEPL